MGGRVRHRPKILTLLHLWYTRRAALQYDWHAAWGRFWNPKTLPAYAAWPMLQEILMDHSSHSFAALAGWSHIPDTADRIIHALDAGPSRLRRKPTWERPGPFDTTPSAHATRRRDDRLRDRLRERLGIHPTTPTPEQEEE